METQRERRVRHIVNGLCTRCVQPSLPDRTLCEYHRKEHQQSAQDRKVNIAEYKKSICSVERERKRSTVYKDVRNAYRRAKKASDPAWAMADRLRKRIGRAIRDYAPGMKLRQTGDYLGCTMDEFMLHIESQFVDGMSWNNRHLWHLDHIKPCAKFNLMDPEDQRKCFHYTNLKPLWAKDNIAKLDRYG